MRDKTHNDQVERWARFVRDNPREVWKKEQRKLVDSQIIIANRFYSRLEKTSGGKEKIKRLRNARTSYYFSLQLSKKIDNRVAKKLELEDKR